MTKLLQIRERDLGKTAFFTTDDETIKIGDCCIIGSDRGMDFGIVIAESSMEEQTVPQTPEDAGSQQADEVRKPNLQKIVRKATEEDVKKIQDNASEAKKARETCIEKIRKYNLDMKLVKVEYSFDCSKLVFYFTSEGRVDFRDLVKELAGVFRTRIEMRQIGVRDETRLLGGIGCCGRVICCNSFLQQFDPVNIKMVKIQRLPLNPTKISGQCGRLLCCVRYEYDVYKELRKKMPKDGASVMTDQGKAKVIDMNLIKQTVTLEFEDARVVEMHVDALKK